VEKIRSPALRMPKSAATAFVNVPTQADQSVGLTTVLLRNELLGLREIWLRIGKKNLFLHVMQWA